VWIAQIVQVFLLLLCELDLRPRLVDLVRQTAGITIAVDDVIDHLSREVVDDAVGAVERHISTRTIFDVENRVRAHKRELLRPLLECDANIAEVQFAHDPADLVSIDDKSIDLVVQVVA